MQTKQTISIIGSNGNMGAAIARSLAKGNYRLLLTSEVYSNARSLAKEIRKGVPLADVEAVDCSYNACWEADIIIVATPFGTENNVAEKIREVANQKIVISIMNHPTGTSDGHLTSQENAGAEELQKLLPNSKVIRAFSTNSAADFDKPANDPHLSDAFIAGDDEEALRIVAELVKTAGFNPVFAGQMSASRTPEQTIIDAGSSIQKG